MNGFCTVAKYVLMYDR